MKIYPTLLLVLSSLFFPAVDDLERQFKNPPDDSKIMMRWWWFGPAVTKEGIDRELRTMKESGIGGFELQPVYPLTLDNPEAGIKNIPFLSNEYLELVRYTNNKAHELGLRFDLTLGSGWPYGGPSVPITQAAGKLRVERITLGSGQTRTPVPDLSVGENLIAVFDANSNREITEISDGIVYSSNVKELIFFISSRTGMLVKRPSAGGEGFVLNHYDANAVNNYLKNVGDRYLSAFGTSPPFSIFCDSLEVFNSDWTPDLLDEFKHRRGYDLKQRLPALVNDSFPSAKEIRRDWGQTLTELLNERFLIPMRDWTHSNNTKFRIQGYGIPPAVISSNAYADISDGEGFQWKMLSASRWASSANHIYGRNVTSSETWTWLHSPSFRATPLDLKAEADLHFIQGINQLIGHGWPYSQPSSDAAEYPGNRFYAAAVFNDKNPWSIAMPDISKYLQRISFMMRQGKPVNDIALYLPVNDIWAEYKPGNVHYLIEAARQRIGENIIPQILDAGFNFDLVDDQALITKGKIENKQFKLGDGSYKIIVLPNVERLPSNTKKKLAEFTRRGGIVISVGGKQQLPRSKSVHIISNEGIELSVKLRALMKPDVFITDSNISFTHRQTDDSDIYFIANTSNQQLATIPVFRVKDKQVEIWNPMTGDVTRGFSALMKGSGEAILSLDLEPYGSRIIVFTKRTQAPVAKQNGRSNMLDISSQWAVTFNGIYKSQNMDSLQSWIDDESTKYYSGTATYEKDVEVSEDMLKSGMSVTLSFGDGTPLEIQQRKNGMRAWYDSPIRDAAVVYINGERAGSVWAPPWSLNVSNFIKPGKNKLRIVVGNTAINYLSGRTKPNYKLLNMKYGERFQPQDMDNLEPLPSGLLGKIELRFY